MKTIYKYEITPATECVSMPKDAEILSLHVQSGMPCIWALVDTDKEKEDRYFYVFGTGRHVYGDIGVDIKFIGTFLMHNDSLVFHLFERL